MTLRLDERRQRPDLYRCQAWRIRLAIVALANFLSVQLITVDRQILRKFRSTAVSLQNAVT
jgi:hypothetical protein